MQRLFFSMLTWNEEDKGQKNDEQNRSHGLLYQIALKTTRCFNKQKKIS